MKRIALPLLTSLLLLLTGCRGMQSDNSPVHINPNMDRQPKFIGQQKNTLFENQMSMRPLIAGTVARGFLHEDQAFFRGMDENGEPVTTMPIPVTRDVLLRGQERYDIYCTVCHGAAGRRQRHHHGGQ